MESPRLFSVRPQPITHEEVHMSEVKLLVFNNGLQVLGDFSVVDASIGKMLLKKPVQLVMVPRSEQDAQQGRLGMAFTPFMYYTEEWTTGVTLSATDVLSVLTPSKELLNNYNVNFGSGLILPTDQEGSGLVLPSGR